MKLMKALTLIMITALSAGYSASAADDGLTVYSNAYQGFSISFPGDWKCETRIDKLFVLHLMKDEATAQYQTVAVTVGYQDAELNLSEQADYLKKAFEKSEGYSFISEGNATIDGKDAYRIAYRSIHKGKEMYSTQYLIVSGGRLVLITRSSIENFPATSGILHDIVNSYRETEGYSKSRRQFSDSLVRAAWNGDLSKTMNLLSSGASVNDVNNNGLCPLSAAAHTDNFDLFSLLLEKGADPNNVYSIDGTTPIFWVNWNLDNRGKYNFYQLLIDEGADLTVVNRNGKTVYQILKEQVYLKDDAKFLKSKGAE